MPSTTKRQGVDPSSTTTTTSTARDLDRREHSPADDDHLQHTATSTTGREEDEDDDDDDDYTSSSGSSDSDSDSDDDEEDEEVNQKKTTTTSDDMPRIPAIPKPRIGRINKNPDLLSRLSAFLPQMKTANEKLEQEIAAGRAKDVQLEIDGDDDDEDEDEDMEGKRYIEMNLGLGVLEEKRPGDDNEEDHLESQGGQDNQHVLPERPKSGKDSNVLDTLMGNAESSAEKEKPTIEEI
ncbi:NOPCHAP1/New4 family protein [Aspergillus tubingensis]|uniref:NOPCHAP1/New4 family protein n=1 Tax=Aspergillus tubingensis TaxID=5068 RepID=UPI00157794B3|nr:similar to An08g04440 [Aspergillus tubingensis]GFN18942.1 similar to An08g04440 [Aspergillus tubingensis]GLB00160.1 hypothetical protein AtubIFM57143_008862 [Aspergillus tubingensis]GLB16752.1 hypothetical protein AtubIFM61612_006606 [Aspergillus tubingensis]